MARPADPFPKLRVRSKPHKGNGRKIDLNLEAIDQLGNPERVILRLLYDDQGPRVVIKSTLQTGATTYSISTGGNTTGTIGGGQIVADHLRIGDTSGDVWLEPYKEGGLISKSNP